MALILIVRRKLGQVKLILENARVKQTNAKMEKTKKIMQRRLNQQESEALSRLQSVPSIRPGDDSSFYEHFVLTGIKVDKVQPGVVSCSFKVPPRLTVTNSPQPYFISPLFDRYYYYYMSISF